MRFSRREELSKKRAVEEGRKAGTLLPDVDKHGNFINPHIPEYMAKAPWYLNQAQDAGLQHQRHSMKRARGTSGLDFHETRKRKRFVQVRPSQKFRKGACRNCGALTHASKDCMERPRKVGAWKTNTDIQPDDIISESRDATWDGARDRWKGYNPDDHKKTVELYAKAEKARHFNEQKKRNDACTEHAVVTNKQTRGILGDMKDKRMAYDGIRAGDSAQVASQKVFKTGTAVKTTARNLRIREDTAKYLHNLDPESAFYDPKSRSMRANPTPHLKREDTVYYGDNFVSGTGEAVDMTKAQLFAWENDGREAANLQANPTQLMLSQKRSKARKEHLCKVKRQNLYEKYGVQDEGQGLKGLPVTSDTYTEYTKSGQLVSKGYNTSHQVPVYAESSFPGNHSSIWGSYFDKSTMRWGYSCCWQTMYKAYCTGRAGIDAKIDAAALKDETTGAID